ncbi:MAG: histidine phosphatase family protein [Lachnospiraceae bacterium]|nr:histidine phosphatase family protein [Lachnospiraceae bacterium]
MKVYLLRHGETDWNAVKRIQGNVNIPLNERGRLAARLTAEAMADIPFDVIFSSPLDRAYETARILAEGRGLEVMKDERLKEIHFGDFEGTLWSDIREKEEFACIYRFFEDPGRYVPERGAESFESILGRSKDFIEEEVLPREGICENMLIVAHGALNRAFLACVRELPKEEFWGGSRKPMKNCGVCVLEVKDGKMEIREEGSVYYDTSLFQ